MKPEEQRIAISEWCGWKRSERWDYSLYGTVNRGDTEASELSPAYEKDGILYRVENLPNYLTSLDDIHEAEMKLEEPGCSMYCRNLSKICCPIDCQQHLCGYTIHATAAQRCEALLKTIGKWRDE